MRIFTASRFRFFVLALLAGIAAVSVGYNIHLKQRVDVLERENAKLMNEMREEKDRTERLSNSIVALLDKVRELNERELVLRQFKD